MAHRSTTTRVPLPAVLRRQAANGVAAQLFTARLVIMGCGLLVNVLSARTMGPSARGHLALLLQITYTAGLFGTAGADSCYPALVDPPNPSPQRAARDMLRLVAIPTILVGAAIAVIGVYTAPTILFAGPAMAVVFTSSVCMLVLGAVASAAGSAKASIVAALVSQPVMVVAAVVLAVTGTDTVGPWLYAYAAAMAVVLLVAWWMLGGNQPGLPARAGPLPTVQRAGLRILPSAAADMIMRRADRLLLPVLGTFAQLGWYIVIATVTEAISLPVAVYIQSRMPSWRAASRAGTLRPVLILARVGAYGALAVVVTIVGGHLLVVPIFGPDFRQSLPLLAPLSAAVAVYGLSLTATGLDLAAGRLRTATWSNLPAVAVSLAAYTLLIPRLGAMGAAWGSLAGYSTAAAVGIFLALNRSRRTIPVPATATTANNQANLVS